MIARLPQDCPDEANGMGAPRLHHTQSAKIAEALMSPIDFTFGVERKVGANHLAVLDEHEAVVGCIRHPMDADTLRPGLDSYLRVELAMQELSYLIDLTVTDWTQRDVAYQSCEYRTARHVKLRHANRDEGQDQQEPGSPKDLARRARTHGAPPAAARASA